MASSCSIYLTFDGIGMCTDKVGIDWMLVFESGDA